MNFAHFAHVWGKPGMTPAERFEELWRELEIADATNFDYGFCVEHLIRNKRMTGRAKDIADIERLERDR